MADHETVSRPRAVERLLEVRGGVLETLDTESVAPDRIGGRTLTTDVRAPHDVPTTDYATMDGYALAAEAEGPRTVVGTVAPEDDPPNIEDGETVAIATGAPLPPQADAVLPREDATLIEKGLADPGLVSGTNINRRGITATANEQLFAAGDRLAPRHAALLSDVGVDSVCVHEPWSVAIVATGTEIHERRQPDRDSDFLAGLVREWGHDPTPSKTVPDDPDVIRRTITEAAAAHDAVLTTGGTSVGTADHVSTVLEDHDPVFAGVALRPGRPVTAALVNETPVIGLPGKPIAAHTAAVCVARALFAGETEPATVSATPARRVGIPDDDIEYAIPVTLDAGEAFALGHVDSSLPLYDERFAPGLVAASTRATLAVGFVLAETSLEPDHPVEVIPYPVVE